MAAKQSGINLIHGAGSQLEGGDIPQKTMEIFRGKITLILKEVIGEGRWKAELEGNLCVPVTIAKLMAVTQSSWSKAIPLLTPDFLPSLWIYFFSSMFLTWGLVYELAW